MQSGSLLGDSQLITEGSVPRKRWISETLFDELGFRMGYVADRVLYEEKTEHQELILFEHKFFGKMLMLDGVTQITARDEYIYQEMMCHVPLFAHGAVRNVLIVGGGDCGIAKEVLKHKTVEHLVQVEIDGAIVELAKEHFREFTSPVFSDARFDCVIGDGADYVASTGRRFEAIIVDSTDAEGPAAVLFTRQFYADCKRCLTPGGVLVTQNGVPFLQAEELQTSMRHFKSLFADASCYVASIPTYIGGHMAIGFATDDAYLRRADASDIAARYAAADSFPTRYWTPDVHVGAFALPRFIGDLIACI
jgi:spermidine synthase